MNRLADEPDGAAAKLVELAEDWAVPIEQVHGGDTRIIGGIRWRFLHPESGSTWKLENNNSLVVRVESLNEPPGSPASILFTGDIEEEAMKTLLVNAPEELTARVVEAPHHGSVRPSTASFLECADPELIVQSTGSNRLLRDQLAQLIGDRDRVVTARNGAISVEIAPGSTLDIRCFQEAFRSSSNASSSSHTLLSPPNFAQ